LVASSREEDLVHEGEQDFQSSPMLEHDKEYEELNMKNSITMMMVFEPLKLL
jgi:hypothetical protein